MSTKKVSSPNIILLMADQFRGDALGIDGNPIVQTPNLNYIASKGTLFRHAYTPCPSCIPARAMLWTGMNQWHTGILSMAAEQPDMPSDYPHTLAGELTKAGYQTQLVGKAHFTPQRAPMGFAATEIDESGRVEGEGFKDDYRAWFEKHAPEGVTPDDHGVDFNSYVAREWHLAEYLHPTAWTMTRAIDFLKRRDKSRPFFLTISFDRPHSPYVPPKPYWDMYFGRDTGKPVLGDWAGMNENPHGKWDPNAGRGKLTDYQIHRARAGYFGEISFVDAQIGRLMTFLRRYQPEVWDGGKGNTSFLFLSDHGDLQGDHHLWRKGHAYEGSAQIPMIVLPAGDTREMKREVNEVVGLMDVMPTVLEMAGVKSPKTVEGKSMLGLIQGTTGSGAWREYVHGEHGQMQYVTDGQRKFIWYPYEGREQFFDLEMDPGECQDLARDPLRVEEIALWRGRLVKELEARDCGWTKGGKLHWPGEPLISPWKTKRWQG